MTSRGRSAPLEGRQGERLVRRHERPAATGVEPLRDRAAERAPCGRDGLVGALGCNLQGDGEARAPRELSDQVVEHGDARRDVRGALVRERDAHAGLRLGHYG